MSRSRSFPQFTRNSRMSGKERLVKTIVTAALAAILFVSSNAHAVDAAAPAGSTGSPAIPAAGPVTGKATGKTITGTFSGTFSELGIQPVLRNECGKKAVEVKDREKTQCEEEKAEVGAGKYTYAVCHCDLEEANAKLDEPAKVAFCHIEADHGSARNVHRVTECELEAKMSGVYSATRQVPALKAGVASAKADAAEAKATAGKTADRVTAVEGGIADLGTRLSGVDDVLTKHGERFEKLEGRTGALEGELHGGDTAACERMKATIAKNESPVEADYVACYGVKKIAIEAKKQGEGAAAEAREAKTAVETLKKGFVLSFGLNVGLALQGQALDGATVLRGGFGSFGGLNLRAAFGDGRFYASWSRFAEDRAVNNGGVATTWGNDFAVQGLYMPGHWENGLTLGIGLGVGRHLTQQSVALAGASVFGTTLQIVPALEWKIADHFAVTAELPIGYESMSAPNRGTEYTPSAPTAQLKVGIEFPFQLF